MPIRVAVASENREREMVHQHFGRATQFLIYEIEGTACRLIEARKNQPSCGAAVEDGASGHGADLMQQAIERVSDCRAVVVAQIGRGAVERLSRRGIHAFVIPDFIDSALRRLIASGELVKPVAPTESNFKWLGA
jgi:nitrogen fixation protein NifX